MNYPRLSLVLLLSILLSACSTDQLDGSSADEFKKSIQQLTEKMSETEREEFSESLRIVGMTKLSPADILMGATNSESQLSIMSKMAAAMDGMTVQEVLLEANSVRDIQETMRLEEEKKQREKEVLELRELEDKQVSYESIRELFAQFELVDYEFRTKKNLFGPMPVVVATFRNNTDKAVALIRYSWKIKSPERATPWLDKDWHKRVDGGIEPGETLKMTIEFPVMPGWTAEKFPKDAEWKFSIYAIEDSERNRLFEGTPLREWEEKRLQELREKYADMPSSTEPNQP